MDLTTIGLSLGPNSSPELRQKALVQFEKLKGLDDGWETCYKLLINDILQLDETVVFVCLQVLENHCKSYHSNNIFQLQQSFRQALLQILSTFTSHEQKVFLRTKLCSLIALVFVNDYPHKWPGFFNDLVFISSVNKHGIDLYLRTLLAINGEIADREIPYTSEELIRNTQIKDNMRDSCIPSIVDTWRKILDVFVETAPDVVCLCLISIGQYIQWIDIDLIANDSFVSCLLNLCSNEVLQESVVECVDSICCKGMQPFAKLTLVENFFSSFVQARLFPPAFNAVVDFHLSLSRLFNTMIFEIVDAFKAEKQKDWSLTNKFVESIKSKMDILLLFLSHRDCDVSGAVISATLEAFWLLKQCCPLTAITSHIKNFLSAVIDKFEYEDDFDFENEGEDEIVFLEYRKQLKNVFDHLFKLDSNLVLEKLNIVFYDALYNWENKSPLVVELAIHLFYIVGECLPVNMLSDSRNAVTQRLLSMVELLVTSNVSKMNHVAVRFIFFDTILRYDKLIQMKVELCEPLLACLIDERGLFSNNLRIASRSCYILCKFIKLMKSSISEYHSQQLLEKLQIVIYQNSRSALLTSNDLLFLYEALGILSQQFPCDKASLIMEQFLTPVFNKFSESLQFLNQSDLTINLDEKQKKAKIAANCISYTAHASKVFTNFNSLQSSGCMAILHQALNLFLQGLTVSSEQTVIYAAIRQYLHRMVACLGHTILQYVPITIKYLLQDQSVEGLHEFIPLVNQIIAKYKKDSLPVLKEIFLPILSVFSKFLSSNHEDEERKLLNRTFLTFINTIVGNDVIEVICVQGDEILSQVLLKVIEGTMNYADPVTQKLCFTILRKFIEVLDGNEDLFYNFTLRRVIPACFTVSSHSKFDFRDAQSAIAVMEAGNTLKYIYEKYKQEVLSYLTNTYLPSLQINSVAITELCNSLESLDIKRFRDYYKNWIQNVIGR